MSYEFEEAPRKRKLVKARLPREMVEKELSLSESDLVDALDSLKAGKTTM